MILYIIGVVKQKKGGASIAPPFGFIVFRQVTTC